MKKGKAKEKKIKETVRKRYGSVARRVKQEADRESCCGSVQSSTCSGETEVKESCCDQSESTAEECCAPSEPSASCCAETEAASESSGTGSEANTSCCDPSESAVEESCAESAQYSEKELADLPDSVTCISLGCGNPITINELKPGEIVLDLGSGGGIDCFLAAKKVGPEGKVIGLDMTRDMLELAKSNAERVGATNVEFHYGEMEDIPLPDEAVDVIMSNCVINLSPDKDAVFSEAYRVLRPGGRVSVSDIVINGELPGVIREHMDAWAGCVAGALEESDYLARIRKTGFQDVEVMSRKQMKVGNSDEWKGLRDLLKKSSISADDLDFKVVSIRVKASKPA
jgi:ubiquinone/menaquinone biosynthesis C-methylase UbiE